MKNLLKNNKVLFGIISLGILAFALPITLLLIRDSQDLRSSAAAPDQLESEAGVLSSSGVSTQSDSGASGGNYVLFTRSQTGTPTPEPGNCTPVGNTGGASAITTFHSAGLYWSPSGGSSSREVLVKFRKVGNCTWNQAYPMLYNPISDTTNDKNDYRGSVVSLSPNTTYEAELTLEGTSTKSYVTFSTWNENIPEGDIVNVGSRTTRYTITQGGSPTAYRVYDGNGATIDVNKNDTYNMIVDASYVIVRNFKMTGSKTYGIRVMDGNSNVVIEDNEFTDWGSLNPDTGYADNHDDAILLYDPNISKVVIQRNVMHHPTYDSNAWDEAGHPAGAQCIGIRDNLAGNHVIRYNECYSDKDHKFNDGFGYGTNASFTGFPGADTDIYGNYVANCWDDCLEIEGGGRNVRVWNNYTEDAFVSIANAAVSIGPLYVFRNVSGYADRGIDTDDGGSYWLKAGTATDASWMRGLTYLFHNTILQPDGKGHGGAGTAGTADRLFKHVVSRNNIYHVNSGTENCLSDNDQGDLDLDYDLCSAKFPPNYGTNGILGTPTYQNANFDRAILTGNFVLSNSSKGYEDGQILFNFSDGFSGTRPDIGAHQNSWPAFKYGINALFTPLN